MVTAVRSPGNSRPEAGADHAKVAAQLGQVPAVATKDADMHARLHDRVELAGHGEDQRGLAAAVGAENGHVLAGADGEVDVVEHDAVAARHINLAQGKKFNSFSSPVFSCHSEPSPARLNGLIPSSRDCMSDASSFIIPLG